MTKRNPLALLGGVGLGAGLMYLLDPDGGRRRRALARDKAVHGLKVSGKALRKTSVDVGNRTRGLVAEAGSLLRKSSADIVPAPPASNGNSRASPHAKPRWALAALAPWPASACWRAAPRASRPHSNRSGRQG